MVRENITAKKSRYIGVRNGGEETYVENIPVTGRCTRQSITYIRLFML